jgi:hypothetical protein
MRMVLELSANKEEEYNNLEEEEINKSQLTNSR